MAKLDITRSKLDTTKKSGKKVVDDKERLASEIAARYDPNSATYKYRDKTPYQSLREKDEISTIPRSYESQQYTRPASQGSAYQRNQSPTLTAEDYRNAVNTYLTNNQRQKQQAPHSRNPRSSYYNSNWQKELTDRRQAERDSVQRGVDKLAAERKQRLQERTDKTTATMREAINAADFDQYARLGKSKAAEAESKFNATFRSPQDAAIRRGEAYSNRAMSATEMLNWMEDYEKDTYYYLLGKDEAKANDFLDLLGDSLNARRGQHLSEYMDSRGLIGKAGSALAGGLSSAASGMSNAASAIFKGEARPTTSNEYASQMVRENIDSNVGRALYDVGYTGANMLPSIGVSLLAGGLGAAPKIASLLGSSTLGVAAGGNAYKEGRDMGYTHGQSLAYGALTGASEAGLQAVLGGISSLGLGITEEAAGNAISRALGKLIKNKGVTDAIGRYIANMGSEATEEYLQSLLEPVFKNIVAGEQNTINPLDEEALYSGLMGALTAGLFESPRLALDIHGARYAERLNTALDSMRQENAAAQNVQEQSPVDIQRGTGTAQDIIRNETEPSAPVNRTPVNEDITRVAEAAAKAAQTQPPANIQEAAARAAEKAAVSHAERQTSNNASAPSKTAQSGVATRHTATTSNGNTVSVGSIVETDNGLNVRLSDGTTAQLSDVDFDDPNINVLYERAASFDVDTANALVNNYTGETSVDNYLRGFNSVYLSGKQGYEYAKAVGDSVYARHYLNDNARMAAFRAGQAAYQSSRANSIAGQQGNNVRQQVKAEYKAGVNREYSDQKLTSSQRKQIRALDEVFKAAGKKLVIHDAIGTDGNSVTFGKSDANAYYDAKTDTYHLSLDSTGQAYAYVVAHESIHEMEVKNKEGFSALSEVVEAAIEGELMSQKGMTFDEAKAEFEKMVQYQMDKNGLSRSEAVTEVVANTVPVILTDEQQGKRFADKVMKSGSKVKAWFEKLIKDLRAILDKAYNILKGQKSWEQMELIRNNKQTLDMIADYYFEGMEGTKGKAANGDGGINYSSKSDVAAAASTNSRRQTQNEITAQYKQRVQEILNGAERKGVSLLVGYTPEIYQRLGMPDLPFVVGSGHVYTMAKTKAEAQAEGMLRKGANYHGLGSDIVENILDYVKDPVMVIAAKDVDPNAVPLRSTHSVVALVDIGKGKESMVIPIAITAERTVDGVRMDVNAISSAYGKNVTSLVNEAIAQFNTGEDSIFYVKKEAANLIGAGVQFPTRLKTAASNDGIIRKFDSKINMSVQNVTESQQFKRWFGDWQNNPAKASKAVNEDGTPKVFYHGTPGKGFTVFDANKAENGSLGKGFYFSGSKEYAKGHTISNGKFSGTVIEAYLNAKTPYIAKYPGGIDTAKLMAEGYDSVYNPSNDFWVVFEPAQIKSATDNVGTFDPNNPDIRFSMKDAVEETRDLIAVHNLNGDQLEADIELGGFPMPSIAITKPELGHSEFGDISLIFGKDTIDPKANRKNKVYGADAWTPTFPNVEYEANADIVNKLKTKFRNLERNTQREIPGMVRAMSIIHAIEHKLNEYGGETHLLAKLYDNTDMMNVFLADEGMLDGDGSRPYMKVLASPELKAEYHNWLSDNFSGIEKNKGIRNNKDTYTSSGDRRSFKSLHYEYNLENIVKAMKSRTQKGNYGAGITASAAKEYNSVKDIKKDSSRIQSVQTSEFNRLRDEYETRFDSIVKEYAQDHYRSYWEEASELLCEAVANRKTREGIYNYLTQNSDVFEASYEVVDELLDLVHDISEMPTEYFEAKPQRAVALDEVKAVVMPEGEYDELRVALESRGIPVETYTGYNERLEKLNSASDRFRFSRKDDVSVTPEDAKKLQKQNDKLQQALEVAKQEIKLSDGHHVKASSVERLASKLLKEYSSKMDKAELVSNITELFDYIGNGENVVWDEVQAGAMNIALNVLDQSSKRNTEWYDNTKPAREFLKNNTIKLNEKQLAEVQSAFGSYTEFRRELYNKAKFSKTEGISLEQAWRDLSSMFPDTFDPDTPDVDMPTLLHDEVLNMYDRPIENPYGYGMKEYASDLAMRLYGEYMAMPERKTFADKQQKKLEMQRARYNTLMEQQREQAKAKYEKLRDQRDITKYKTSIEKNAKSLYSWLTKPNNSKHVPEALRNKTADLLKTLEFDGKKGYLWKDAMRNLQTWMQQVDKAKTNPDIDNPLIEYAPDLIDNMQSLLDSASKYNNISDMPLDKLKELNNIVAAVKHTVTTANTVIADGRRQYIDDIGGEIIKTAQVQRPKAREFMRKHPHAYKVASAVSGFFNSGNVKPIYFFDNIGGEMKTLFNDVRQASYKSALTANTIREEYAKIKDKYHYKEWSDKKGDLLTIQTKGGGNVSITREQALDIYATAKREKLIGTQHLTKDGFVFNKDVVQKNGKLIETATNDNVNKPLSEETIAEISDWLTKEQKEYADALVELMSTKGAELGNEVTMQMYGINRFSESYYIPIMSAHQFIDTAFNGRVSDAMSWMNKGFTKNTVAGARNPIVITGITQKALQHMADMATYNAMAIPQDTMAKVYNYKQRSEDGGANTYIRAELDKAYGQHTSKYIKTFINDISGNITVDPRDSMASKMISAFRRNAVSGKLSVAIQQPSAIVRATALVDPKYFFGHVDKNTYDTAKKYSGTAVIKEVGGFDAYTGKGLVQWMADNDKLNFQNARDAVAGWLPQKMDEITWCRIWKACENEVADTTALERGSEDFYKAVGHRFDDVIEYTQVYDSVISRSEYMRSKSAGAKLFTSFKAEPTVSYNMYWYALKHMDEKGGKARLLRTAAAVIGAGVFNAMLKSVITAIRDDDENQNYVDKYVEALAGNLIGSPLKKVPFIGDHIYLGGDLDTLSSIPLMNEIVSMLQGYTSSRSELKVIQDLINAAGDLDNENKGLDERLLRMAKATSQMFGIPLDAFIKDWLGVIKEAYKAISGNEPELSGNIMYEIREGLGAKQELELYKGVDEAISKGDYTRLDKQFGTMVKRSTSSDPAKKASETVRDAVRQYLDAGEVKAGDAKRILSRCGYKMDDAEAMITKWDFWRDYPEAHDTSVESNTETLAARYFEYAEPLNIDKALFYDVYKFNGNAEADKDKNGNSIRNSKRDKVADYINKQRLTKAQKDALWFACGYKESTLDEAPWR